MFHGQNNIVIGFDTGSWYFCVVLLSSTTESTDVALVRSVTHGALFYSPVDFTDASDLNTLMQVWCIGEINLWIKQRTHSVIPRQAYRSRNYVRKWRKCLKMPRFLLTIGLNWWFMMMMMILRQVFAPKSTTSAQETKRQQVSDIIRKILHSLWQCLCEHTRTFWKVEFVFSTTTLIFVTLLWAPCNG